MAWYSWTIAHVRREVTCLWHDIKCNWTIAHVTREVTCLWHDITEQLLIQVTYWWNGDNVSFSVNQHALFDIYSASSLKQLSTGHSKLFLRKSFIKSMLHWYMFLTSLFRVLYSESRYQETMFLKYTNTAQIYLFTSYLYNRWMIAG